MAKKQFKAESKRLLDLMIHSIYTHQEIFLREIISNASDAIDKLAYRALTDEKVGLNREDFKIEIKRDDKLKILTISDNGIGMDKEEMETNLGTICKSGSLQFKQEMEKQDDLDIIGQFGVGFYSAFMVADTVTVISRKYGSDEAYMWQSSGADGYTVTETTRACPGTDVIMKLKDDTEEEKYSRFVEEYELKSLVKKYSDYIRYPIRMDVTVSRRKEGSSDDKPEYESVTENQVLNSMVPIWQRAKKDVTEEELNTFYRDRFYDFEPPAASVFASVEGTATYKALLFIPSKAPYDFYTKDYKKGLQLYSSGVLIMENCEDLLPDHFRFVRGVVDSQDLSLNISREMLQHDRQLKLIAANLEKKIRQELEKLMKDDREKYEKFYAAFGRQLKFGTVNDYGIHKETLQDLLLLWSSRENKLISLKEYTEAMGEEQKFIFYATGENRKRLEQLPQMAKLKEKNYDVLFFTEDVDEFIPQTLQTYAEKSFKNITSSDLELDSEEEKKEAEEQAKSFEDALKFMQEALGEKVKLVRASNQLGSHPCCMVPESGMSFEMEKYFKKMNPELAMDGGRILEVNPAHPVLERIKNLMDSDKDTAAKLAELLYSQACIMADLPLEDPTSYTDLVCSLLAD